MRRSVYIYPPFRRSLSVAFQVNRNSYIALPLHNKLFSITRPTIKHHGPRTSANMSGTKMPASHGHSEACCNIPPIVVEGYEPKGKYETINGMKTCMSMSDPCTVPPLESSTADYPNRCHRPYHSLDRYPLHLRYLRLFPTNTSGCRHPSDKRPRPPVPSLHA